MPDTTNFAWTKPTVGGSSGSWGTLLNALFDDIDTDLLAVQNATKLPIGAASGTSGTVTLDLESKFAKYFTVTPSDTLTFAFSNVPTGGDFAVVVIVKIVNSGAETINWPASVDWPGGSAPSFATAGTHLAMLVSDDDGTTWRGNGLLSFA
jgi:hypothetical protein